MLQAAFANGWLKRDRTILESLTAIKRRGGLNHHLLRGIAREDIGTWFLRFAVELIASNTVTGEHALRSLVICGRASLCGTGTLGSPSLL